MHRQIARFGTLQYSINVRRRLSEGAWQISFARLGIELASPPPKRKSIRTCCPSTQPGSARRLRKAATDCCVSGPSSALAVRQAILRIPSDCCAADAGHAAVTPIPAIKSRPLHGSPPRARTTPWLQKRAAVHHGRTDTECLRRESKATSADPPPHVRLALVGGRATAATSSAPTCCWTSVANAFSKSLSECRCSGSVQELALWNTIPRIAGIRIVVVATTQVSSACGAIRYASTPCVQGQHCE